MAGRNLSLRGRRPGRARERDRRVAELGPHPPDPADPRPRVHSRRRGGWKRRRRRADLACPLAEPFRRRPGGGRPLLRYDGGALTVIGVMSPNINYPYDAALWTPWTFQTTNTTASSLNVVARLADGASIATARSDADRLHPDRQAANLHGSATGFDVATVRSDFIRDDGAHHPGALGLGPLPPRSWPASTSPTCWSPASRRDGPSSACAPLWAVDATSSSARCCSSRCCSSR